MDNVLDGAGAEIIGAGLHGEAINADGFWLLGKDHIGDVLFSNVISVNDGGKMVNAYEDVAYFPYKSIIGISANKRFTKTDDSVNFQTILLDSAAKKPGR